MQYASAMNRAMSSPSPAPPSLEPAIAQHWLLDPAIAFLNHGSFGATPRVVLEAQSRLRGMIEARPIEMLARRCRELLDESKKTIGPFIGAIVGNFVFVTNATGAINAVLRSLEIRPGDELLTTNHVYNAVRQTMKYVASRAGATMIEAPIPLPLRSPGQVIEAIEAALTRRTRLLVVDHVASPTAALFPLAEIVALCKLRGVDVLVDGAHAPGMIDLNIEELAPAYYTGNLHKWPCAPKGSAFLWVRPDKQGEVHPTTISHHLGEGFQEEFGWQGTRDITAWVCAADSIRFMDKLLPGGWPAIMKHNHAMATWVQAMLCERWGVEPSTPLDGSMLGSMTTVPLPPQVRAGHAKAEEFQARLYKEFLVEVPIVDWQGQWWTRPCCQVYNSPEHYERLAGAVLELMDE
jgi:isopenicillin-N epimerase